MARKIPYKRILIKIKIVELFKKPLFMVYKGKEVKQILANIRS